jgi:hypothetical protein
MRSTKGKRDYFGAGAAGASGVVVVVVVVVLAEEIGFCSGAGAAAGAGAGASSVFFLHPAAKTVARASTSVREISFFICVTSFCWNSPFERNAHGFENQTRNILAKNHMSIFF